MTVRTVILAAAVLGGIAGPAAAATSSREREAPDFGKLWAEARQWAEATGTVPEDCVFEFRFDAKTKALREGYAATCEEPYRSPFYPWPAPSRPGVRFDAEDIVKHARELGAEAVGAARPGRPRDEDLYAMCGIVVGFTPEGRGAEAIECHSREARVHGQPANAGLLVETADGRRIASRLYARITHLRDPEVADIAARVAAAQNDERDGLQVEGQVVKRDGHRLLLRGRARPLVGESASTPGVVMGTADIVVEYPSDEALRPGYYFAGEHCFKEQRTTTSASGATTTSWVYGPCAPGPDRYWAFEQFPPGRKTVVHGPYPEYGQCDGDRARARTRGAVVGGHCVRKAKVAFRMIKDGSLVMPKNAPPLD